MELSDFYYLGNITKMHGLDGHVLLKLDTDEPSLYYKMESVFVELNGQPVPFFIEQIDAIKNDTLRILFKDVEAAMLVGREALLPLNTLPPLQGKQFYYHEVIGFEIRQEGQKLGEIIRINDRAAQPYFIVAAANSSEQIVPIINEWILQVDRAAQFIEMNLPEGIMDL